MVRRHLRDGFKEYAAAVVGLDLPNYNRAPKPNLPVRRSSFSGIPLCRRFPARHGNPSNPKSERQAVLTIVQMNRVVLYFAAEVKRTPVIASPEGIVPYLQRDGIRVAIVEKGILETIAVA
jgi:hypothetical protein